MRENINTLAQLVVPKNGNIPRLMRELDAFIKKNNTTPDDILKSIFRNAYQYKHHRGMPHKRPVVDSKQQYLLDDTILFFTEIKNKCNQYDNYKLEEVGFFKSIIQQLEDIRKLMAPFLTSNTANKQEPIGKEMLSVITHLTWQLTSTKQSNRLLDEAGDRAISFDVQMIENEINDPGSLARQISQQDAVQETARRVRDPHSDFAVEVYTENMRHLDKRPIYRASNEIRFISKQDIMTHLIKDGLLYFGNNTISTHFLDIDTNAYVFIKQAFYEIDRLSTHRHDQVSLIELKAPNGASIFPGPDDGHYFKTIGSVLWHLEAKFHKTQKLLQQISKHKPGNYSHNGSGNGFFLFRTGRIIDYNYYEVYKVYTKDLPLAELMDPAFRIVFGAPEPDVRQAMKFRDRSASPDKSRDYARREGGYRAESRYLRPYDRDRAVSLRGEEGFYANEGGRRADYRGEYPKMSCRSTIDSRGRTSPGIDQGSQRFAHDNRYRDYSHIATYESGYRDNADSRRCEERFYRNEGGRRADYRGGHPEMSCRSTIDRRGRTSPGIDQVSQHFTHDDRSRDYDHRNGGHRANDEGRYLRTYDRNRAGSRRHEESFYGVEGGRSPDYTPTNPEMSSQGRKRVREENINSHLRDTINYGVTIVGGALFGYTPKKVRRDVKVNEAEYKGNDSTANTIR